MDYQLRQSEFIGTPYASLSEAVLNNNEDCSFYELRKMFKLCEILCNYSFFFIEISQKYQENKKSRTKYLLILKKKRTFVRDLRKMRRMSKIPKFDYSNP